MRLTLLLVLVSTPSIAQTLVAVVPTTEAEQEQALRINVDIIDLLRADARLEISTLAERKRSVEKGLALLRQADTQRKATTANDASDLYEQALAALKAGDWREETDAYSHALGWHAAVTKSDDELRLLFTARPQFTFPPIDPVTDSLIEEARQAKAAASTVEFSIESDAPALVWLDGVLLGAPPLTAKALAGRHRITAESIGRELIQEEELIAARAQVQLRFVDTPDGPRLRAALAEVSGGFRAGEYLTPIKHLLELARTREVVVVGLSPKQARIVRMNDIGKASISTVELAAEGQVEAIATAVRSLYDRPIGSSLSTEALTTANPQRTASYVLFGASGAAAVAGGVLLGVSAGQFSAANNIPQTHQAEFDAATAQAGATRAGGIVTLCVGVAAIAVGAVLFATSSAEPPTKKSQPTPDDERLND